MRLWLLLMPLTLISGLRFSFWAFPGWGLGLGLRVVVVVVFVRVGFGCCWLCWC